MSKERSVLIAGATGLVGKHCLDALIKLNVHQNIHVLSRRSLDLDLPPSHTNKVHVHIVDFEQLADQKSLFNVDEVICCLGTTLKQAGSIEAFKKVDYEYCLNLAKQAKEQDVSHFLIVTAVNANANAFAYYSKTKGQLQNALKYLGFPRLSIFQPSLLLGERSEFRTGEDLFGKVSGLMNQFLPRKMSRYKAIEGKVVGSAMAQLAANEALEKVDGTHFYHYDEMQALHKK